MSLTPYADNRGERTRAQLKTALLKLLAEKSFAEIRIKELAVAAAINRVTFYDHYYSKEELLVEMTGEVLGEYADVIESVTVDSSGQRAVAEIMKAVKRTVQHVYKHRVFYRIMLLSDGVPDFVNQMHEQMEKSLRYMMRSRERVHSDVDFDLYVNWIIGGAIGVYKYWLKSGMSQPEDAVARQLLRISLSSNEALSRR
ncbi:TetR/AcrR family transcriptional regulator C-terminal domain-containing protein [Cohnella sp.]|uniref:TetR/AcrR family transcriptional regulator n=1 Tax=Cohnella sp. TaxID=1883426 RepID=UPI003704008A